MSVNILLACNGGVSTGMIAKKMEELAKEQGKDYKVWAVDDGQIELELQNNPISIVLLGPQIRFKLKSLQKSLASFEVPIMCMDTVAYGMNDAAKILEFAEKNRKDV